MRGLTFAARPCVLHARVRAHEDWGQFGRESHRQRS
jgi:hypothetical protein